MSDTLHDLNLAAWECACAVRASRDHTNLPVVREAMIERALGHADRAWDLHVKALAETDARERGEVAP